MTRLFRGLNWLPLGLLLLAAVVGLWLEREHRPDLAFFAAGALGGAGLIALFIHVAVTRRLMRLFRAVGRFADGDVDVRLGWTGTGVIARLGMQFDYMVTRLERERVYLAEGEERLNFALRGSSAGIWDWRIDRGQTYYSPRWKSLLGFLEAELVTHAEEWLKRVHPEDLLRVIQLLNAHLRGESDFFESEHRLRRKDGGYIWVLERGMAIRGEDGQAYRMVGALTDISRRKEMESALRRSEEEYRSVVEGVTQVIFRSNGKGCLTFLNPAWRELTGFPVEASLSRPLADHVHPADRDEAGRWFEVAAAGGAASGECEFRLLTRQGEARWFRLHARAVGEPGGEGGIAGVLTDIDAQKRAQDALAKSNTERDTILNMSPNGFVFADCAGRVTYVNPAFLAMTGFAGEEIEGGSLADLEARIRALCDPEKPMPAPSNGADEVADTLHLDKPAKKILERLVRGIRDDQGKVQGGIMFFRDVTREVEVDRMKSEFLSTAAHELRTPMASIFGFSELLLMRDFDAATRRELHEIIHRQTRNLTNLVDELLDLARIEARGGKSFKFREQTLLPIVVNAAASQYLPAETHRMEVDLPPTLPWVNVDADKLHQALVNVLGNAVKYSPRGGVIRVSASSRRADGRDMVGISIRDQGIGMTPEQMEHVFDRFYRADASGAIPGTGLGMCLVKEIMEIFGGEVTMSSAIDQGTEVTLWLPVYAHTDR
ncbi:MAG: PAS domain-containing protein [Candidatus Nitricoxidivorans perseverans]|uniref:histidine kinase n=1 Tax=Candidatus Nitricoxidivorans perseverans TaxID=2975601 RepID=A0AA49FL96_9PROT|nr:MAG: PAS domain-containing protein [Candidatus Nitricoxidivorans perseverans]